MQRLCPVRNRGRQQGDDRVSGSGTTTGVTAAERLQRHDIALIQQWKSARSQAPRLFWLRGC